MSKLEPKSTMPENSNPVAPTEKNPLPNCCMVAIVLVIICRKMASNACLKKITISTDTKPKRNVTNKAELLVIPFAKMWNKAKANPIAEDTINAVLEKIFVGNFNLKK